MTSSIAGKTRPLPPGIFCPVISLYKSTPRQEIDYEASYKYFSYLIRGGVDGLVLGGTTAEAVLLSPSERQELIKTARRAAVDLGFENFPLVAGISGQSTNESIRLAQEAREAGADFGLLLPPSYGAKAVTKDVIIDFYKDVASENILPIVIYSVSYIGLEYRRVLQKLTGNTVPCCLQWSGHEFGCHVDAGPASQYCRCQADLWKCGQSHPTYSRVLA